VAGNDSFANVATRRRRRWNTVAAFMQLYREDAHYAGSGTARRGLKGWELNSVQAKWSDDQAPTANRQKFAQRFMNRRKITRDDHGRTVRPNNVKYYIPSRQVG